MLKKRQNYQKNNNTLGRISQGIIAIFFLFSLVGFPPTQPILAQTETTNIAIITDFGVASTDPMLSAIASLIYTWEPEAIVTAGDNYHHRDPTCNSFASCTELFSTYIAQERFFPAYGNHDAMVGASTYSSFFNYLPTDPSPNSLYYDVLLGNIHFWVLDGNVNLSSSGQEAWLAANAPDQTAAWNIAVVHQAPYSTGYYGDMAVAQIPYENYGIDFVISGHNHHYERLEKNGVRYFIAGYGHGSATSGRGCVAGKTTAATSEICTNDGGYMQITATDTEITFTFLNQNNSLVDSWYDTREEPTDPVVTVIPSSLSGFFSQPGVPSAEQSYTVSGVRLEGGVTITAPSDFEISESSGSGFGTDPILLSSIEGTLSPTQIFVRLNRATAGVSNGIITHISPNANQRDLAVSGTASETTSDWVAFNDVVWATGQPSTNITTFTIPGEGTSTGTLIDYNTGNPTPASVTITAGGSPVFETSSQYGGSESNSDTDAYQTFHGIADMAGLIRYGSSGWYVEMAFSGLDPGGSYTFATTANRAGSSYTRNSRFTISGVDSAVNASSPGVNEINNESVYFNTGYNTIEGYVARWNEIDPGTDGEFKVRVEAQSGTEAYGPSVFMLAAEVPSDLPNITIAGTLMPFSTDPGHPSTTQTYQVSGVNLNEGITISAPDGFELSTDGSSFFPGLILPYSDGSIELATIYVRLTGAEGVWGGNITHTSDGANPRNVSVSGKAELTPPWTAYNDMSGSSTPPNTTEFTLDTTNSMLLDFDTGDETGVTVTVTSDGDPFDYTDGGEMPTSDTDAHTIFDGKVNLQGVIMSATSDPIDYWVDVTFNNLEPTKTYTFVATANRAGTGSADPPYDQRATRYTISGMDDADNASSTGVNVINEHSVYFITGTNTSTGYVAKWVNIQPGTDGSFTVRAQPQVPESPRTYAFGAFMLSEEAGPTPDNQPPVLDPIGEKSVNTLNELTFTANATDDGLPSGALIFSLAGNVPEGASIDSSTGVFSWTPTAQQGPEVYSFDLCVSDGELEVCETLIITVTESGIIPPLPSSFYGEIHFIDGDGGPDIGDMVYAYLDDSSTPIASADISFDTLVNSLVYRINAGAYPDGTLPDNVTFKIGDRTVASASWNSGTNVPLNIHPPKADAGGPYVVLLSEGEIQLSGSAQDWGNDVMGFAWDLDNDAEYDDSSIVNPDFSFDTTGVHTVNLKVTDQQGGEGISSTEVFVITLGGLTDNTYNGNPHSVSVAGVTSPYSYQVLYGDPPSPIAPTNAGDYNILIQVKNSDVVVGTLESQMVIDPKPASVTPSDASKTYGDDDPVLTGILDGFLLGDTVSAVYSRVTGETVAGGPYQISAVLNPADVLDNYDITYNTADFTIDLKSASVTPSNANKTYGEDDPALTGALEGFLAEDNVTATYSRATGETVAGSPYEISAVLSPAEVLDNYEITYNTANFTINPKLASVTPDDASKTYGDDDPVLTGVLDGFLPGDTVSAIYSRIAGETVAGGPYQISAVFSPADVLDNYEITYYTADFTIDLRPITVTADNQEKALDDDDPALTFQITSGSLAFSDSFSGTLVREAGEVPGAYAIEQGTLAINNNYDLNFVDGVFTIKAGLITVTVDEDQSKIYGSGDPTFTYTTSNPEIPLTGELSRIQGENVGTYEITRGTLSAGDNYAIELIPATFTIDRKPASVTPSDANKTYGDDDPVLTGVLDGFLADDNVTAIYSRIAGETVVGGPYLISAALSPAEVLNNYDIIYNTANFTIDRKPASVTPDDANKTYGEDEPVLTGVLDGFLAKDNVTALYSRVAGETVADGPYLISAALSSAEVLNNYDIIYNTADFTIDRKPASVTPSDATKTYGDDDPVLTGVLDGFLAGDNITAIYSRVAGETVADGPYLISTALSPAEVLNNYDITYNTADFTIGLRPITVTADDMEKARGHDDPALTFQITNGSLAFSDSFSGALVREMGEDLGAYVIEQGTLMVNDNYTITFIEGTFTILDIKHSISLVPGWNLVSFNVVPDSNDIEDVLASIDGYYTLVYAWDASVTSNHWLKYDPSIGFGNTLNTLDETLGFWIHMTTAATLDITGTMPLSTQVNLSTAAGGWNLVGYPAQIGQDLPGALADHGAGDAFTLVYAYHAADTEDQWKVFDPEAPLYGYDLEIMEPGWGYWVFVTENVIWEIEY